MCSVKKCTKPCCDFGEHTCSVPMPIAGRVRDIDSCIADIVAALNAGGLDTVASCCGHDKIEGSIVLADGRRLLITSREAVNLPPGVPAPTEVGVFPPYLEEERCLYSDTPRVIHPWFPEAHSAAEAVKQADDAVYGVVANGQLHALHMAESSAGAHDSITHQSYIIHTVRMSDGVPYVFELNANKQIVSMRVDETTDKEEARFLHEKAKARGVHITEEFKPAVGVTEDTPVKIVGGKIEGAYSEEYRGVRIVRKEDGAWSLVGILVDRSRVAEHVPTETHREMWELPENQDHGKIIAGMRKAIDSMIEARDLEVKHLKDAESEGVW